MIYNFKCGYCGKDYEVVQKMNDEHTYFCCGMQCERVWTVFNTNKDLLYNFKTPIFNNRVTEIHSKKQYNRLLKENKMVDISRKELQTIKPKDNAFMSRKNTVKKVCERLKQDGVAQHFKGFVKDVYGRKQK